MNKNKRPVSRKEDIVVQEMDGELLIYDLRSNKAFCLNQTSSMVWRACDGTRSVTDLSRVVSENFGSQANDDVIWLALDQLRKEDLLSESPDTSQIFGGMSRRDAVRRISVGSMVALPVIAGLVAPPAFAQASTCGTCVCNPGNRGAGDVCPTSGGGTPCANSPAGCNICRATVAGSNQPGACFTA